MAPAKKSVRALRSQLCWLQPPFKLAEKVRGESELEIAARHEVG